MEEIRCLNCCEILQNIFGREEINRNINKAMQMGKITKCERIYFGSYFCGQYFIHMPQNQIERLISYCRKEGIQATLVVPILTEKQLQQGKMKIEGLSQFFSEVIDEITINDYGMLDYLYKAYVQNIRRIKLNIGRLLMKDYRDPRYTEYFNIPLKPRSFTKYLNKLVQEYEINCLELDPTHACIQCSERPEGVKIAMHTPYCYETVGQICQMAAIDKPIEEKFRANESCKQQCLEHKIHYFEAEGCTWIKQGKVVYFKNEACRVEDTEDVRFIYSPLEWEEEK